MTYDTQTTLGNVLADPEAFEWSDALYADRDEPVDEHLACLVHDIDDVADGDDDLPQTAVDLGYEYVIDLQTAQGIVDNARAQRPDADLDDLLAAFRFYLDNDAFIDGSA